MELGLLPFLIIPEEIMEWLLFSLKCAHTCPETACNFPSKNTIPLTGHLP